MSTGRAPGASTLVQRVYGVGAGPGPRRRPSGLPGSAASDGDGPHEVVQARAAASAAPATTVATSAGTAAAASPSKNVTVTVTWSGKFGGDLSANVAILHEASKDTWKTLASTSVADPDAAAGTPTQKLSASLSAERQRTYRVVVTPTAGTPDDRYRKASKELSVDPAETTKSVHIALAIERTNQLNVDDAWEAQDIDPDKAADTVTLSLLGRRITVNRLVEPRVQRTNELFAKLPAHTQKEIIDSIAILGGYNRRTTKTGAFSNHSTGCAVDINYNEESRQNFHFYEDDHKAHLEFVEIEGREVEDKVDKRKETLVGMIPLHKELLQIFLDAGWSWGGDWQGKVKDYMHFEDKQAANAIKKPIKGKTP